MSQSRMVTNIQTPRLGTHTTNRLGFVSLLVLASAASATLSIGAGVRGAILYWSISLTFLLLSFAVFASRTSLVADLKAARIGPLVLLYAAGAFGIATLTVYETATSTFPLEAIPSALMLAACAFMAFTLGYRSGPRVSSSRVFEALIRLSGRMASTTLRPNSRILAVYLVGLAAVAALAALNGSLGYAGANLTTETSDYGWYVQPLAIVSDLRSVAVLALSFTTFRYRRGFLVFILVVSLDLLLGLVSGMKESSLVTIAMAALGYMVARRRLPVVAAGLTVLVFALFLSPFTENYRAQIRTSDTGSIPLGAALSAAFHNVSTGSWVEQSDSTSPFSRFRLIDNLAVISYKTPNQIPYRSTDEFLVAPITAIVPRAIWPDKPLRLSGLDFYRTYYGGSSFNSAAITMPGSLYMFGGAGLMIAGMLLLGVAIRGMDDAADAINMGHGTILIALILPTVVKQEQDVVTFIASIPIFTVTYLLATVTLFAKREPEV